MTKNQIVALFPGSFDPITLGHLDLIQRSAQLCDKLVILVMNNLNKQYLFNLAQRKLFIQTVIDKLQLPCVVEICESENFLIDEYVRLEASLVIRGIRSTNDFMYEQVQEQLNIDLYKHGYPNAKYPFITSYLMASPSMAHISSTSVRALFKDPQQFLQYAHLWISPELVPFMLSPRVTNLA